MYDGCWLPENGWIDDGYARKIGMKVVVDFGGMYIDILYVSSSI